MTIIVFYVFYVAHLCPKIVSQFTQKNIVEKLHLLTILLVVTDLFEYTHTAVETANCMSTCIRSKYMTLPI